MSILFATNSAHLRLRIIFKTLNQIKIENYTWRKSEKTRSVNFVVTQRQPVALYATAEENHSNGLDYYQNKKKRAY